MAFVTVDELKALYPKAANLQPENLTPYLARANAFCKGEIGGQPPTVDDDLKTAVVMAFEIFAQDDVAQIDEVTGNITDASEASKYTGNAKDPFDAVKAMLRPYKLAFDAANVATAENGVRFL